MSPLLTKNKNKHKRKIRRSENPKSEGTPQNQAPVHRGVGEE